MKEESLSSKVTSSLLWKFFERGSVQIMQLIIALIIARILGPEEYGSVALLTIFISIATVFVQSGLNTALIQKKDADEMDISSVFYYSLVLAIVLYVILFFVAGSIARFYEMPKLKNMLRVLALILFPGALNSIQLAVLSKKMQFRKQFYSSFFSVILSGGAGIVMACLECGAWALIVQQLSYQVFVCILLWFLIKWRPKRVFSFQKTKGILKFGGKLLGARLIDTIYHNLESLIIGKRYSSEMLAYCDKGKKFPLTLIDNIDGSVQSVMLPAYASKQENISEVKRMLRRTVSMSTYLVFPAMIGLAAVAEPLILLILGKEWIACVPFLQLYCAIAMLFPLQTANLQAINAIGHSGTYFWLMLIKRVFGVGILFASVFFLDNVYYIVLACLITEVIGIIANFIPNKKLLDYSFFEQMKDILPNLLAAIFMGVIAYFLSWLPIVILNAVWLEYILILLIQCIAGVGVYLGLSILFKNHSYNYIKENIKKRIGKK